jgi:hypothetical protein
MTPLKPLLDTHPRARVRALLRAGAEERPPGELPQRIVAGLAAGVAASGFSATASGAAAGGVVSKAATVSSSALAAKWLAIGTFGGGVLTAGLGATVSVVVQPTPVEPTQQRAPSALPSPRAGGEPDRASAEEAPSEAAPDFAPSEPATTPARPRESSPSPAAPAPRASNLGREVELIDAARAALRAGDASRALHELDAHRRVATTGILELEARVLRIEALIQTGRTQEAEKLTNDYLRTFPNDAHARRLRGLLPSRVPSAGSIEGQEDIVGSGE